MRTRFESPVIPAGLSRAFEDVLGPRLHSLVVYGSALTGDLIPGFSDLDLALFTNGPLGARDGIALQRAIDGLERGPVAYLQLSHTIDISHEAQRALFVPHTSKVLVGEQLKDGWLHTESSLLEVSRATLAAAFDTLHARARDWAVASGPARGREIRVMATRLKPAVRALIAVRDGESPAAAFALTWAQLAEAWAVFNPSAGQCLERTVGMLPPAPGDEQAAGELLLTLLAAVAVDSARGR